MTKKILVFICISLLGISGGRAAAEERTTKPAAPDISVEDMKIIKMMDILKLMDLAKNLELIRDLDILTEENNHESKN